LETHTIAIALLVRDGRALLAHRHPDRRWYPDCWDLVGGHVEPGESPEQALRRECLEEIGVVVSTHQPLPLSISSPSLDAHAFLVTEWTGQPSNLAPEEHDDLAWQRCRASQRRVVLQFARSPLQKRGKPGLAPSASTELQYDTPPSATRPRSRSRSRSTAPVQ